MSEETKEQVAKKEPEEGNPSTSGEQTAGKESPTQSQDNPNRLETLEKQISELTEKLETVNRQYKGSTEEALRLKKELEVASKDKETLQKAIESNTKTNIENNDVFQELVEKEGALGAIRRVAQEEASKLAAKISTIEQKEAEKVYQTFKSRHPGLEGEVLARFDKEFDRLKSVYDSPEEAMEAAYAIAGGIKADAKVEGEIKDQEETKEQAEKSKNEAEQVVKKASESGSDKKAAPADPQADLKGRIVKLKRAASTKEANGGDAMWEWAQIDELEKELDKR